MPNGEIERGIKKFLKAKYIGDELQPKVIKSWGEGDIILINAQTGSGKTSFVFNNLKTHCKENNKTILLLSNRNALKGQNLKEVKQKQAKGIIQIFNYQELEFAKVKDGDMPHFDYIVADECHYFFSDATFNNKTDLIFRLILEQNKSVRILLSATISLTEKYLDRLNIKTIKYEMKTDYSYIKEFYYYNSDKVLEPIFSDLQPDEKLIYFTNAEKAYNASIDYGGAFLCSKDNRKYGKKNNAKETDSIINEEKFKSQLLCTTNVLDNGVNIKDPEVKHIVVDLSDLDTIQQCIGRLRPLPDQKVNIYIKNRNKHSLGIVRRNYEKKIFPADFLRQYSQKRFTEEYGKEPTQIVYSAWENDNHIFKINEMMYFKCKEAMNECELMEKNKDGFIMAVNKRFNRRNEIIKVIDYEVDKSTLSELLGQASGKKMFKEEQKEFKNFLLNRLFDAPKKNHGSLGLGSINSLFVDLGLKYIVESGKEKQGVNRDKTYWIIRPQ